MACYIACVVSASSQRNQRKFSRDNATGGLDRTPTQRAHGRLLARAVSCGPSLAQSSSTLGCLRAGGWVAPDFSPPHAPMPYLDTTPAPVVDARALEIQAQAR